MYQEVMRFIDGRVAQGAIVHYEGMWESNRQEYGYASPLDTLSRRAIVPAAGQ